MATFKKGQTVKVKYTKYVSGNTRTFSGTYEVIRTGANMYLFDADGGIDLNITKKELEIAIENYENGKSN